MSLSEAYSQLDMKRLKSANRPKIGLVLGGGGAKGAAQVGILKAFEEAGLEFDYIAGTSIGSIIGALYSCGYRASDLENLFLSQPWLELFTGYGISEETSKNGKSRKKLSRRKAKLDDDNDDNLQGFGLSKGDLIVELFDSLLEDNDNVDFDKLPIPFRCVATDIKNQEPVVLKSGNLALAIRASMSIPAIFKPVKLDGRMLVDGGMQNNLPVDVARDMGAEYIIAIDLSQAKHTPRDFSLKETLGIGGMLDWLVSRPDWTRHDKNVKDSDFYINPKLDGYEALDFQREKIEKMIAIGYKTGKEILKKAKK